MKSPLRSWREGFGLTQLDLAQLAGVSQGHISDIENGHTQIDGKLLDYLKEKGGEILALREKQEKYIEHVKERLEEKIKVEG